MGLDHTRGPVAQLDRASDFESEGCAFKSCRGHHFLAESPAQGIGSWLQEYYS